MIQKNREEVSLASSTAVQFTTHVRKSFGPQDVRHTSCTGAVQLRDRVNTTSARVPRAAVLRDSMTT